MTNVAVPFIIVVYEGTGHILPILCYLLLEDIFNLEIQFEKSFKPLHKKTNNVHMRKQRRRSASLLPRS